MKLDMTINLCIVDNGFVYVGYTKLTTIEGKEFFVILNGYNVRKSGTTNGFGEIALGGPTSETVLDPSPIVLVPYNRMCHLLCCDSSKWDVVKPV